MMEEIPSFLYPGLAQLQKRSGSEGKGRSPIFPLSPSFPLSLSLSLSLSLLLSLPPSCLPHFLLSSFLAEVMQKLASWTVQCLNLDVAKQSPMSVS